MDSYRQDWLDSVGAKVVVQLEMKEAKLQDAANLEL